MQRRTPICAAVILASLMPLAAACGRGGGSEGKGPASTASTTTAVPDLFCDLISVTFPEMRSEGISFSELVEDRSPGTLATGLSAGIGFAVMMRGRDHAGRFEPVLVYLTERSVAETPSHGAKPPKLTAAIRSNAKELDRFLADGGCG